MIPKTKRFEVRSYAATFVFSWLVGPGDIMICLAQETVTEGEISTPLFTDRGIEEEILGPFRIWHIIFLSMLVVITIIVVLCWCYPVRVPRTRQEIEDNYHKRVINRDYLRLLERNPDKVVKKTPAKISATESSRRQPRPGRPDEASASSSRPGGAASRPTGRETSLPSRPARPGKARDVEEDDPGAVVKPYRPVAAAKAARVGAPTPLALNPRALLALMAKRREDGNQ